MNIEARISAERDTKTMARILQKNVDLIEVGEGEFALVPEGDQKPEGKTVFTAYYPSIL